MKTSAKLKQLEDENKDAMFVFISDVWLDQVEVLEKLHTMFSGRFHFFPVLFWALTRGHVLKLSSLKYIYIFLSSLFLKKTLIQQWDILNEFILKNYIFTFEK